MWNEDWHDFARAFRMRSAKVGFLFDGFAGQYECADISNDISITLIKEDIEYAINLEKYTVQAENCE